MQESTPLPPNPFTANWLHVAYERCLDLEAAASSLKPPPHCPSSIVCARILGHLMRLAPGPGSVQHDISRAADRIQLMEVAGVYLHGLIRTFKRGRGPTPPPSRYPSDTVFEDVRQYNIELEGECQLDHRKARDAALCRDNYRCAITGQADVSHDGFAYIEGVHIIPDSNNMNIAKSIAQHHYSVEVYGVTSMFTSICLKVDLAGNRFHRLENILSMSERIHRWFGDLFIWLKPVKGSPHKYSVHLHNEGRRQAANIPEFVQLSTTTEFPLPHSPSLALHALCCEVAWLSGAGEYIMDVDRRITPMRV